jgi:hypothetical protein
VRFVVPDGVCSVKTRFAPEAKEEMGLNEAAWTFLPNFVKTLVVLILRIGAMVVVTLWLIRALMESGVL